MMKRLCKNLMKLGLVSMFCLKLHAIDNNKQAPDFSLLGEDGKTHRLSQFKGQIVVLEWFNHDCPFVKKHYGSGNMQKIQKMFKGRVAWLTINSSAVGKQGSLLSSKEAYQKMKDQKMMATHLLLDGDGKVGRLYGAKTTPHMYIIDKSGKLVYQGAIDSIPSADPADIGKAQNYMISALNELLAGKKITSGKTRPYGCSVKY